jgi:adenosine kinase
MSGDELIEGVVGADLVVVNDYELEILKQKTGRGDAELLETARALIVTRGEHGSSIVTGDARTDVRAVEPRRIVDPTGVGDAFRGGFVKGLALGLPLPACAQVGGVAATYALEHLGGQSHAYSWREFKERYEEHFGPLTAA